MKIGAQAFDLKCTIPEITETGEPLLIYLDVSWLLSDLFFLVYKERLYLTMSPDASRLSLEVACGGPSGARRACVLAGHSRAKVAL